MVLIFEPQSSSSIEGGLFFVSYFDGTYSKYGNKSAQFPDFQDEQPGYHYPTHWQHLPNAPE